MKALALRGTGGLEHLELLEVPTPALDDPESVLVRVRAVGLNHLDLHVARGLPGIRYVFPHVVGSDAAGVVEQVGARVARVRTGDRVMINPTLYCGHCQECTAGDEALCRHLTVLGEHRWGTAAEYLVVPEQNVARLPDGMPWPEAAAFSLAALTAWRMLTTRARLGPGETLLIWGIGGGVAQALLLVAKLIGSRTIVTSRSDAKLEAARALGPDVTLNHGREDVVARVREVTGGTGADVIADSVGECTWQSSLRALRRGGRLVTCGATSGPAVTLDLRRLFWHHWSILGSTLGNPREYAEVVELARKGKLWPSVDRVLPLADWRVAFERLEQGQQFGKLVLEVSP